MKINLKIKKAGANLLKVAFVVKERAKNLPKILDDSARSLPIAEQKSISLKKDIVPEAYAF